MNDDSFLDDIPMWYMIVGGGLGSMGTGVGFFAFASILLLIPTAGVFVGIVWFAALGLWALGAIPFVCFGRLRRKKEYLEWESRQKTEISKRIPNVSSRTYAGADSGMFGRW